MKRSHTHVLVQTQCRPSEDSMPVPCALAHRRPRRGDNLLGRARRGEAAAYRPVHPGRRQQRHASD
eukprot:scaffold92234_cov48-Phaeocystis_antarctica.AAC.1